MIDNSWIGGLLAMLSLRNIYFHLRTENIVEVFRNFSLAIEYGNTIDERKAFRRWLLLNMRWWSLSLVERSLWKLPSRPNVVPSESRDLEASSRLLVASSLDYNRP